ncbi:MAG: amino acid permease [Fusobacteriaceae bacterium]|nr:amino acid permease [Fusobacteriaceae bacterium]MBN2837614.1 amino acid permease [Fusobacteriaceae bacterium]
MSEKKLGLFILTALGIGTMIGGGIFNSPTDLINLANPLSTLIAWIVGGLGVFFLVMVFEDLSIKKPELKGGIYSYAREGFGDFAGYFSTFGYWIGGLLGVVAYFPLFFKTLNSLLSEQNQISPLTSFIFSSLFLWGITVIILLGIRDAGIVSAIVTLAKLLPLILVVIVGITVFKKDIFLVNDYKNILASTGETTTMFSQIKGAMGTILWCFLGVEAAVVMSGRAESQKIVSKATKLAFFITLIIYMLISSLAMGIIEPSKLANAQTPLADVLFATKIGAFGAIIAKVGLMISIMGATLSWILLVIELPWLTAKDGIMPKFFVKENKRGVPVYSLIITQILIQLFLFSMLSEKLQATYSLAYNMSTSTMLIPYLFTGLYAVKIYLVKKDWGIKFINSILATIYSIFVLYAVGMLYLSLTLILFSIGLIPFHIGKMEKKEKYKFYEKIMATIFILVSIYLIFAIYKGLITI